MSTKYDNAPRFRTLGTLAEEVGISLARADYIVRSRGIEHGARAGTLRLFDEQAVQRVRVELKLMTLRREWRHGN